MFQYNNKDITLMKKGEMEYIKFNKFSNFSELITHGFTTRKGGVSRNEFCSMNLGFKTEDARQNVLENYQRICAELEIDYKNMVLSDQVHDAKIYAVDENDRGKGILQKSDIIGYDGLMTNIPQVALVTFFADCVPLFFLDPVKKVVALSHSGWRGTVKNIAAKTMEAMNTRYGSLPSDTLVVIGPSIGPCCFETGNEAYSEFKNSFDWFDLYCKKTGDEKWHINLQGIIKHCLILHGVKEENIVAADLCTQCNRDTFFSYRGDKGKTGRLAAIIQLR